MTSEAPGVLAFTTSVSPAPQPTVAAVVAPTGRLRAAREGQPR